MPETLPRAARARVRRHTRKTVHRLRPRPEPLEERQLLSAVSWSGTAGDLLWSNPKNWSGNQLPGASDDVTIAPTGSVTIVHDKGTDQVASLNLQQSLSVTGGSLAVSGQFSAKVSTSVSAAGSGVRFAANGPASIDGTSLSVTDAATVAIPGATSYTNTRGDLSTVTLKATGAGSVLDLHNLTSVTQSTASYRVAISVQANAGGKIDLSGVTQFVDPNAGDTRGRSFQVTSDGVGSLINLSALTQFQDIDNSTWDGNWTGWSYLTARNSGTIQAPALTNISNTILTLDGTGTIPYAQLVSVTGSQINLSGGSLYAFTALANGNGTAVSIGGANIQASFPALTTLKGGSITVNGANTSAAFPSLTVLGSGSVTLAQGGTATVPLLADINGASLSVADGVTLALPSATSYTNTRGDLSTVTLKATGAGSVLDLHNLTSVTQSTVSYRVAISVQANAGGKIDLSGVTQFVDPNAGDTRGRSFQVTSDGVGSLINLSDLTQFQDIDNSTWDGNWTGWSSLTARNSGTIQAPALINVSNTILTLDGTGTIPYAQLVSVTGSQLNLSGGSLYAFTALANGNGTAVSIGGANTQASFPALRTLKGGSIAVNGANTSASFPSLTVLGNGSITLAQGGTATVPLLADINGASLSVADGVTLTLPSATSYTNTRGDLSTVTLKATGAGSVLDLRNITTVTQSTTYRVELAVQAMAGGVVNLSGVTQFIDPTTGDTRNRSFNVLADGNQSVVDLINLTQFQDISSGSWDNSWLTYSYLTARNGGTLRISPPGSRLWLGTVQVSQSSGGAILWGGTVAPNWIVSQSGIWNGDPLATSGLIAVPDGGTFEVNTDLTLGATGRLDIAPTGTLYLAGSLTGTTTQNAGTPVRGSLLLDGAGTSALPQKLEVMGRDLGSDANGFTDNFVINRLELVGSTYVQLVDQADNSAGMGAEALYVNSLIVPVGTTLDLNGLKLYVRGSVIQGSIRNGTVEQLLDSGPIAQNMPTPGTIGLPGEIDEWSFYGRAGRQMTIAVNPGGTSQPATVAPYIGSVKVSLLSSSGEVLGTATTTTAGAVLTIANVALPADGTYRVKVQAAPASAAAVGNYLVSVWDSTPDVTALELNHPTNGKIETPYSVGVWTFAATANQQVRFKLVNRTSSNIVFTLTGPSNWTGFTNLGADSNPLTLPTSGTYTLTARGTGGLLGGDYAFRMDEVTPVDLALGTTFTGTLAGDTYARLFRVVVPDASPMTISLDDQVNTHRNELYARMGAPPTRSEYDARFTATNSADQTILIPRATAGTWYFLVYGDDVPAPSTYTLRAATASVMLVGVTPERVGSAAPATLTLSGAGFVSGTTVDLVADGGTVHPAETVTVDSPTQITATFAANSLPADSFAVRVTRPGGAVAQLPAALRVTAGGVADLRTNLILPSALGYHGTGQIVVEYRNAGDLAMPAPLLTLSAKQNGREGGFFTLDPSRVTGGFWTSAEPDGFSHSVQFLARGSTPGLLQPGESGQVTVYYAGWQQPWGGGPFLFSVGVLDSNNTTPIDWASIKDEMRPPSISPEAWTPIFANLAANTGTTWGNYVRMLDENASYLGRLGRPVYDIGELLSFEVQQAIGLGPIQSLASATDAVVTAPGLDITFSRVFLSSLDGRNTLGPLGRGWVWASNWDYRSSVRADGTVVIASIDGGERLFQPDSRTRGAYFAQPGDRGTISNVLGNSPVLQERDGTRYTFDASGHVITMADPNGNTITATYAGDRIIRLTHSAGQFLQIDYNAAGRIVKLTDPVGRETTFAYDASNEHLLKVTNFDGAFTSYEYATGQGAALEHALVQITPRNKVKTHITYDAQGRLASMSKDGGVELSTFSYDTAGTVSITTPASDAGPGGTSRYYYDQRGQVARQQDALGVSTYYTYSATGSLLLVSDAQGRSTSYEYGSDGLLTAETDAMGHKTSFEHNGPFDRMTAFVNALGIRTGYAYDAQGNLRSITYPDANQEQWTYDAQGNALTSVNRRNQTIRYTYDSAGRVTSKTYPDNTTNTFTYDTRGNLIRTTDATGTTTYDYEAVTDRLAKITYPGNRSLQYTYGSCGRRKSMTDETGYVLSYNYDTYGRLASLTDSAGVTQVAYTYDSQGILRTKTLANGVYTTYSYDAAGQVLHLVNSKPDGSVLSSFAYEYDDRGLRQTMDTVDGKWFYKYDDIGQLVGWTDPAGSETSIRYDALGNRLSVRVYDMVTPYFVNALNQYTQVGSVVYAYDADGNLTRRTDGADVTTFSYTADNRLLSTMRGSNVWANTYDALGNRVATTTNGVKTSFVIDPTGFGNVVGEYQGTSQVARNVYGFDLISRKIASGTGYYTFDALGNTRELTGAGGAALATYSYVPFGAVGANANLALNPYRFVGAYGVRDESSGLVSMRARYYDNWTGRFMTEDPLDNTLNGEINKHTYSLNEPLLSTDPSGLTARGPGVFICMPGTPCQPKKSPCTNPPPGPNCTPGAVRKVYPDGRVICEYMCTPPPPTPKKLPPPPPDGDGDDGPVTPVIANDPNEKLGPAGYGASHFVAADTSIVYRINFENDATATAPAQRVDVSDRLSPDLEWTAFRLASVGWGDTLITIPDGGSFYRTTVPLTVGTLTYQVQVELGLRIDTGEVYAQFLTLDPRTGLPPDAMTGFLPPEDGTGRGMGFFTYTLQPRAGLASGTPIRNIASIQFDRGAIITTNQVDPHDPTKGTDPTKECLNTIDSGAPTSSVTALASDSYPSFPVKWSGQDDMGGSGVRYHDVYASVDGGPFTPWMSRTLLTQSLYTNAQPGHTYAFYSIATDNVGNVESTKAGAETQTTILPWTPISVAHVGITASPTTIAVQFSGPLDLQPMISDGTIFSAVSLVNLQAATSVDLHTGQFAYDSTAHVLTWSSPGNFPAGQYSLELTGSSLFDTSGHILTGGQGGNLQFHLENFTAMPPVQAGGQNIQVDGYSVPALADWNDDGLPDLIVGEKTTTSLGKERVYLNTGTAAAPVFGSYTYVQSNGADYTVPATGCLGAFPRVFDWNGDGKKDLLVGTADGHIQLLLNTGTDAQPTFGTATNLQVGPAGGKADINVGARAAFDIVDWNDDGKPDLVVGALDGRIHVFLNDAASGAPDFTTDAVVQDGSSDLLVPSGRASVAVTDIDQDGRKDLVVGNTNGQLLVYRNVGTDAAPAFSGSEPLLANGVPIALSGTTRSRPFIGDFNHDGVPDILLGAADGLVRWFHGQAQPPTAGNFNTSDGVAGNTYTYTFTPQGVLRPVVIQVASDHPAGAPLGSPVVFTATLRDTSGAGAAVPTGTVQFQVDGIDLGAPVPLRNGVATSPAISTLGLGQHRITVVYSGDSTFLANQVEQTQTITVGVTTVQAASTTVTRGNITAIVLTFSDGLTASRAQDLKNYLLVSAGADRKLGTRDDVKVAIKKAGYNAATHTVTLTLAAPLSKSVPSQLMVKATNPATGLTDSSGRLIDGNRDGKPGGDLVTRFGPLPVVRSVKPTVSKNAFTTIAITFSEPMDPTRAQNLANYLLQTAGADGRWGTSDDQTISLKKATYNAATRTVTLTPAKPLPTALAYQLTILATNPARGMIDVNGNLLDGNRDGTAGGNAVTRFGAVAKSSVAVQAFDILASGDALPRLSPGRGIAPSRRA